MEKFYQRITNETIDLCLKYRVPPAVILAIAGYESGYGNGYISRITGNILSLGAGKEDKGLKRLYLPLEISSGKVLIDTSLVKGYAKDDIKWELRPPSYKKDYRPDSIAGTNRDILYFTDNPLADKEANLECVKDFVKNWLSHSNNMKIFREARVFLDKMVAIYGEEILFDSNFNKAFIDKIGGRKQSFNYRKSWVTNVKIVMRDVGLVELVKDIWYHKKNFEVAWKREFN